MPTDTQFLTFIKATDLYRKFLPDSNIFKDTLTGPSAIGHNRYSTTGSSRSNKNIQPFVVHYRLGNLALAHNGNLTNAKELRDELVNEGAIFQTTSDSEVILHLIARSRLDNQVEQIREALRRLEGSYSLLILTDDKLIATRDHYGFRPLSIGKLNGSSVMASETCAFDIISGKFIREVQPGEIVVIDKDVIHDSEIKSFRIDDKIIYPKQHCIFEYIYFSRPDSFIFGHNVDKMRRRLGKILAKRYLPCEIKTVIK